MEYIKTMEAVNPGTFWSLRGTHGELTVEVTDVVDGPNPVVLYNITDDYHERSRAMAAADHFVEKYEPLFPEGI